MSAKYSSYECFESFSLKVWMQRVCLVCNTDFLIWNFDLCPMIERLRVPKTVLQHGVLSLMMLRCFLV